MEPSINQNKNMEFEEEHKGYEAVRSYPAPTSKMARWMITYSGGRIKDEEQASYILIGCAIVAIIISLFLFFGTGTPSVTPVSPGVVDY